MLWVTALNDSSGTKKRLNITSDPSVLQAKYKELSSSSEVKRPISNCFNFTLGSKAEDYTDKTNEITLRFKDE